MHQHITSNVVYGLVPGLISPPHQCLQYISILLAPRTVAFRRIIAFFTCMFGTELSNYSSYQQLILTLYAP